MEENTRTERRGLSHLLLLLSLALLFCLPWGQVEAAGKTLTVGPEQTYKTLSAALAAAEDGDTLEVVGAVDEPDKVTIDKNVTLTGSGTVTFPVSNDDVHPKLVISSGKKATLGSGQAGDEVTLSFDYASVEAGAELTLQDGAKLSGDRPGVVDRRLMIQKNGKFIAEGGKADKICIWIEGEATFSGGNFTNINESCVYVTSTGVVDKVEAGASFYTEVKYATSETTFAVIGGHVRLISGGTIKNNIGNAITIRDSHDRPGKIDEISGGDFICEALLPDDDTANQNHMFAAVVLFQEGRIGKISGGNFSCPSHQGNAIMFYNLSGSSNPKRSSIGEISGGTFDGELSGILLFPGHKIESITGGVFKGGTYGLYSQGMIGQITNGTFYGGARAIRNKNTDQPISFEPGLTEANGRTLVYEEGTDSYTAYTGYTKEVGFTIPEHYTMNLTESNAVSAGGDEFGGLKFHRLVRDYYLVTFDLQGHGDALEPVQVTRGEKLSKLEKPTADGYTFKGWFTDKDCQHAFDEDQVPTDDITLYAKWEENKPSGGDPGNHGGNTGHDDSSTENPGGNPTKPDEAKLVLKVQDMTIYEGDAFDPMDMVTEARYATTADPAKKLELKDQVKVTGAYDPNKRGTYVLTFTLTAPDKTTTRATVVRSIPELPFPMRRPLAFYVSADQPAGGTVSAQATLHVIPRPSTPTPGGPGYPWTEIPGTDGPTGTPGATGSWFGPNPGSAQDEQDAGTKLIFGKTGKPHSSNPVTGDPGLTASLVAAACAAALGWKRKREDDQ